MKLKINGYDVECSPAEFRELVGVPLVVKTKEKKKVSSKKVSTVGWTDAQDNFIIKNKKVYPRKKLARMLNKEFGCKRTSQAVSTRLWDLKNKGRFL